VRGLLVGVLVGGLSVLFFLPGHLFAGCDPAVTRALTCYWLKWTPDWCFEGETEVAEALMYFDIEDSLLDLRYESILDDTPEITLLWLRDKLEGKRVVLLSTHGDLDSVTFEGRMAVEYFASYDARDAALAAYYEQGYFTAQDITAGVEEIAGDSVYVIVLTEVGSSTMVGACV